MRKDVVSKAHLYGYMEGGCVAISMQLDWETPCFQKYLYVLCKFCVTHLNLAIYQVFWNMGKLNSLQAGEWEVTVPNCKTELCGRALSLSFC